VAQAHKYFPGREPQRTHMPDMATRTKEPSTPTANRIRILRYSVPEVWLTQTSGVGKNVMQSRVCLFLDTFGYCFI